MLLFFAFLGNLGYDLSTPTLLCALQVVEVMYNNYFFFNVFVCSPSKYIETTISRCRYTYIVKEVAKKVRKKTCWHTHFVQLEGENNKKKGVIEWEMFDNAFEVEKREKEEFVVRVLEGNGSFISSSGE